ncbi:MAG: 2,5-diamino-6-(ribosylamino)-4(3H)-pyrimidinone 5'-phosphate reductase [Promethearchaeia archaeon]
MSPNDRPYVILSAAMTIDGKIASKIGDPELSDEQDWKEVHKLRTLVDAIMVGKGTILNDDPKLHIKYFEHNGYYRIVMDSNLSIPLNSKVITFDIKTYPTIICITENVPNERIERYEQLGVRIIKCGKGPRVNIENALYYLKKLGINSILLEGGGNLNWSFIKSNLVDEIRLTIAPWIVGGKDAITLVEGEGFDKMINAPRFKLVNISQRNNYVVLKYERD